MAEKQMADVATLVSTLESTGTAPSSDSLDEMARILAKQFGVDTDEVAILKVVPKFKALKFVIPEKLTPVGTIPLTSTTALAARTARERKPELMNNFSSARHANVFEAVPLGRDPGELIQKIMSAPSWMERKSTAWCRFQGRPARWRRPAPTSRKEICWRWCRSRPR